MPDSVASTRICQKLVASPMVVMHSDISRAPPIRNERAP